jgi:hypothetical protein
MSETTFTVLLPVHRPPDLLPFAVRSVLDQARQDFELFIVCDGAPEATVAAARGFAEEDPRVRVFAHPKGERNGEAWRHQALEQAAGRLVCHIADDDLWFDDHLVEVERLLSSADFGNVLWIQVDPEGRPRLPLGDLGLPAVRAAMLGGAWNFFGIACACYRLEAYRALPVGWSPAPQGTWSDLWMWRKFLSQTGMRVGTSPVATILGLPSPWRGAMSLDARREETARYAELIRDPQFRESLWRNALRGAIADTLGLRVQFAAETRRCDAAEARAGQLAKALGDVLAAAGDSAAQTALAQAALEAQWRALDEASKGG